MPQAIHRFESTRDPADLFASWCLVSERLRLTPPDLRLEFVHGPMSATLGACFQWRVRRWGLTQRWTSEILVFDAPHRIIEVQRQGPFPKWEHTMLFEATSEGSCVQDVVDFDSPTGLLGRWLTAESVQGELERAWTHRDSVW